MFFETILLPFVLGVATNKVSQELFRDDDLYLIAQQIYNKSEDEFNEKYKNKYGGKYNNFISRQENQDKLIKNVLGYRDVNKGLNLKVESFDGTITPDEVIQDFLSIFEKNLEEDERLIQYKGIREHHILTEEILEEIKKLTHTRVKKFESISTVIGSLVRIQPYIIKKTENEISEIFNALAHYEIIILDSFRGFGKSETLFKTSTSANIVDMFENFVVMKHGVRNIFDALQTEIIEGKSYLILIDDVDLCKDEFLNLINFVKVSRNTIKIVATTQTYMLEDIKCIVIKSGLTKRLKSISLNNWVTEDFIELLRKASSMEKIEDEDLITIKYPSPTLISWIGKAKNNARTETVEELFNEYQETLKNDVYEILKDILAKEECNKLVFNLSCSVPFAYDEKFKKAIKDLMGISETNTEKAINRLVDGGVIRKVGYKYRFFPDLKGDVYLAYSLKNNLFFNETQYWLNNMQERMLDNINEARLICEINISEIIKPIVTEWLSVEDYFGQKDALKKAIYIVGFAPDSILNLIYCYLEYAIKAKDEKYFRLTTDDFSPLLLQLWQFCKERQAILEFVRLSEVHALNGIYDNYKVKGVIEDFFSPVTSPIETINNSLDVIRSWLQRDKEMVLIIVRYALSEVLKGSHEVTKTIINGVQFGQRVVNATEEIVSIRNTCISIIDYLLNEKFTYETMQVIEEICNALGTSNWSSVGEEELPLYTEIIRERGILVDIIGDRLLASEDIACNIILERILIRWWASQYKGAEKAEEYLVNYTRSPEYLFIKYYVDDSYRIFSFEEVNGLAPKEDRWKWFVHNIMHKTDEGEEDAKKIAELLNKKICSTEELAGFLNRSANVIRQIGICWTVPRILDEWCILNIELFTEYVESSFYYETHELLRGNIFSSLALSDINNCERLIKKIFQNQDKLSLEEVNSVLSLATNKILSDSFVASLIDAIIRGHILKHPSHLIHRLYFIFKERDKSSVTSALIDIIKVYQFDTRLCDMLDFILKQFNDELRRTDGFTTLREMIVDKLTVNNEFEYHENSILETLLNNDDEALSFLDKRLSANSNANYREVPYHGFTFLKSFIVDEVVYDKLITIIIDKAEKGFINQYDKRSIYKPLFTIKNSEGESIVCKLLFKYIKENNSKGVIEILEHFIILPDTLMPFVKGIIYLNELEMQKEAERLIIDHRNPYGGWSRSIGSNSPEILNKIELYREMYEALPYGKLKTITERCIDYLENDMKKDLIADEETLNPR